LVWDQEVASSNLAAPTFLSKTETIATDDMPMAKKITSSNGRDRLDEAMALLVNNQAAFVSQLAENNREHLKFERETHDRFARIEAQMAEIIRVLNEHGRILQDHGTLMERLTEAVREKIGFKSQLQPNP
jgi:hypothetical protein